MILGIVGTHEQPFNRLVAGIDVLPNAFVQYGHSTAPKHANGRDFLPFEEITKLIEQADSVVTHAGTGTVMHCLSLGKVPVVMPRLARFGEHIDDHQMELVESLTPLGLIVPCLPGDDVAEKINEAASKSAVRAIKPASALVDYLSQLVLSSAA